VLSGALALCASVPGTLLAQGQVDVTTRIGALKFDRAASLETAPLLGVDVSYSLSPQFSLGTSLNVGSIKTRAEDFLTTQTYGVPTTGDTTFIFATGQTVNMMNATLTGVIRPFSSGRVVPFALLGAGYYGIFMDPQINRGTRKFSGFTGTVGAGLQFQLSSTSGIQLDVRDLILTNYDAAQLEPSDGRFAPSDLFDEDFTGVIEPKSTLHNFAVSLGFKYTPGGASTALPANESNQGGADR
jgi:hypothetical protein